MKKDGVFLCVFNSRYQFASKVSDLIISFMTLDELKDRYTIKNNFNHGNYCHEDCDVFDGKWHELVVLNFEEFRFKENEVLDFIDGKENNSEDDFHTKYVGLNILYIGDIPNCTEIHFDPFVQENKENGVFSPKIPKWRDCT